MKSLFPKKEILLYSKNYASNELDLIEKILNERKIFFEYNLPRLKSSNDVDVENKNFQKCLKREMKKRKFLSGPPSQYMLVYKKDLNFIYRLLKINFIKGFYD